MEEQKIIKKIDKLETHDRFKEFTKQEFDIGACCQDLINQRPFGEHAFYIFAHARTEDDGVTKRLIWQPRLTKPKAQTNSMLFKVKPPSDEVKIIWMIPPREMWPQFGDGLICESNIVNDSIQAFLYKRDELEAKEADDLDDEAIEAIYRGIANSMRYQRI